MSTENYRLLLIWHVEFHSTATSNPSYHSSKSWFSLAEGSVSLFFSIKNQSWWDTSIWWECITHISDASIAGKALKKKCFYFLWFPTTTLGSLYWLLHRNDGHSFSSALKASCRQTLQPYPLSMNRVNGKVCSQHERAAYSCITVSPSRSKSKLLLCLSKRKNDMFFKCQKVNGSMVATWCFSWSYISVLWLTRNRSLAPRRSCTQTSL